MAPQSLEIIFGTASFGNVREGNAFGDDAPIIEAFRILKKHGVKKIDSAQLYGESEATLGRLKAVTEHDFVVDTKWIGGWTGNPWATKDTIVKTSNESLQRLGVSQVDVFYMHSPDTKVSVEETLKGIDEAYRAGAFKRFGLSNYTPAQTREVLEIAKKNGFVKPTVYQGNYSAIARGQEDELIPLLRQEGIAFYAYSPIAGGLLAKNRKFVEDQQGRFAADVAFGIYHKMYTKPPFLAMLDEWEAIANSENISKTALAYRWVNYHSALKPQYGDGIIIGASKVEQVEQTLQALEAGPLSESSERRISALWDKVKGDSIIDNFQAVHPGS